MPRIPFGEVKRDIKSCYNHMEYECKYYGGDITVILDRTCERVSVDCTCWHFSKTSDPMEDGGANEQCFMRFSIDEFMAMSYKELTKQVDYCLFY